MQWAVPGVYAPVYNDDSPLIIIQSNFGSGGFWATSPEVSESHLEQLGKSS